MNRFSKIMNKLEAIFAIICFFYYVLCILFRGYDISVIYIWPIMSGLLIIKILICFKYKENSLIAIISSIYDFMFATFLVSFFIFSFFVIGCINDKAPENCDYIIVLGASVKADRPSDALQKRINAAYFYMMQNPKTKAIGTGAKGKGMNISEGECIIKELEKMGIDKNRLLYEKKSKTTVENMKFALMKIDTAPQKIAVCSNGFHIFRSKMILRNYISVPVYGIASSTIGIFTPHYILREYIVFIIDLYLGNYKIM